MLRKGFTLIEIVTAISLLLLIFGVGSAFSINYLRNSYLTSSVEYIVREIYLAQADAVSETGHSDHGVVVFPDRVVRYRGGTYAGRDPAYDIVTILPAEVEVTGDTGVQFEKGVYTPAGAYMITVGNDLQECDISISAYGLVETTERTL